MRTRKFVASNMKAALEEIKRELGAEAMIIATRPVRRGLLGDGVEVTAAVDEDAEHADGPTETGDSNGNGYASNNANAQAGSLTDRDLERILQPLRDEMRNMHSRMRPSSRSAETDALDSLRRELGALKQSIARVRIQSNGNVDTLEHVADSGELLAGQLGSRVALVGPTGVGKTTTIAKLAARAALVDGLKVGIVTMDTFRIGAEEQIRAYADLIGVPLVRCAEPARLGDAILRLGKCDRVFIDTPGYGPSEAAALATLGNALLEIPGIDIHLVVAAASSADDLDRAAARYRVTGPTRMLFTKVDEAHHTEELVRAPIRLSLPVRFVATGQRVPEDLEEVSRERLLRLAETGLELATEAA